MSSTIGFSPEFLSAIEKTMWYDVVNRATLGGGWIGQQAVGFDPKGFVYFVKPYFDIDNC